MAENNDALSELHMVELAFQVKVHRHVTVESLVDGRLQDGLV
jgi:hypothetical protein